MSCTRHAVVVSRAKHGFDDDDESSSSPPEDEELVLEVELLVVRVVVVLAPVFRTSHDSPTDVFRAHQIKCASRAAAHWACQGPLLLWGAGVPGRRDRDAWGPISWAGAQWIAHKSCH